MKKKLKYLSLYIIMVCCFTVLSGCGGKTYNGKDLVDNAKSLHTGLEAAHITVTDCSQGGMGVTVQEIWYRFSGDVMQYMYIGHDAGNGEDYYEFNNGTELDTWHTGDTEWSFAARGTEGYYNYSRVSRHYFADGAKLLEDYPDAVSGSEVSAGSTPDGQSGARIVVPEYSSDTEKIYSAMEGVSGYKASYIIGDDGYCVRHMMSYEKDGRSYMYIVDIGRTDPEAQIERMEPEALRSAVNGQ